MPRQKLKTHSITIRISETDLTELKKQVLLSGLNQTEFIITQTLRANNQKTVLLAQNMNRQFYVIQKLLMTVLYEQIKDKKMIVEYVDKLKQEAYQINNEEVF